MKVNAEFTNIESGDELEIDFARACNGTAAAAVASQGRFLGFDVAGTTSPFYSIVGDFGPESEFEPFRTKLNAFGLFDWATDAAAYLDFYQRRQLPGYDMPFTVWQVGLHEEQS